MEVLDLILSGDICGLCAWIPWYVKAYLVFNLIFLGLDRYLLVNTSINVPDGVKKQSKVIIIGGGLSGIGLACILTMAGIPYLLIEKASEFGGTWWYNNFPGAAVDVKAHSYTFSFFRYKGWRNNFPTRNEILHYIRTVVIHYGLEPNSILDTSFLGAQWDQERSVWIVECEHVNKHKTKYEGRFLVNCMGFLYKPNTPKFKGLEKFKGRYFHSAQWEHDFDWTNKRVAVVGNGATAVQVVPEVAKTAKSLTMFQRSPCAVMPKQGDVSIGPLWRLLWKLCPGVYTLERFIAKMYLELFYYSFDDTWFGRYVNKTAITVRETELKDYPELNKKFTFPDPLTFCKRIPIYNGFYSKFAKLGCQLETSGIEEVTETGIKTKDGKHAEFDLIVFCIGFDMFHYKDSNIVGLNGYKINDVWDKDVPYARNGCQIENMPNYFMMLGPQAGQIHGAGSVYYGEMQSELIWRTIKYTLENGFRSFCLKSELMDQHKRDYQDWVHTKKAWLLTCSGWYHKGGKAWQPWVWPSYQLLANCKYSDIKSQYNFD